jgi:hypothetical protein
LAGLENRRNLFEFIGVLEMAVFSLGRAVDMVMRAAELIDHTIEMPAQIAANYPALNKIRNAYEHVEDRALGRFNRTPDPYVLPIFDWQRLFTDGVVVYDCYELELQDEVLRLVAKTRQFLKDAAAN